MAKRFPNSIRKYIRKQKGQIARKYSANEEMKRAAIAELYSRVAERRGVLQEVPATSDKTTETPKPKYSAESPKKKATTAAKSSNATTKKTARKRTGGKTAKSTAA